MAFFMPVDRRWRTLMLCLALAWALPAPARVAGAYLPATAEASPLLWWAVDTSPATQSGAPATDDLLAALRAWLQLPRPGQRVYPPDGIRLGLLALLPDRQRHLAVRELHPPVALDAVSDWPARERSRLFELSSASAVMPDGQMLTAALPALPAGELQVLELTLPVQADGGVPAHLQVEVLTGDDSLLWRGPVAVQPAAAGHWRLTMSDSGLHLPLPATRWRIAPVPAEPVSDWRWLPWSAQQPALWFAGWREPAIRASGRAQLLAALDSLRAPPGGSLPGSAVMLAEAVDTLAQGLPLQTAGEAGMSSLAPGCASWLQLGLGPMPDALMPDEMRPAAPTMRLPERRYWQLQSPGQPWPGSAALLLTPDAVPAALDRWRDEALAAEPVLDTLSPRFLAGQLLGLDAFWLQAVPGRLAWPGDHAFLPCATLSACPREPLPSGDLAARLQSGSGQMRWLTDAGVDQGQPLRDWSVHMADAAVRDDLLRLLDLPADAEHRAALQSALQDVLTHPPLPQGSGIYLDDGPDPLMPGGRHGYLAMAHADGGLMLLAADGQPLWLWRPQQMLSHWLRHRLDVPGADPALLRPGDWQLWPTPGETAGTMAGSSPGRHLYGLVDGQLLALDVSSPLSPRRLFSLTWPDGSRIGSLTTFSQAGRPRLLLARGSAAAGAPVSDQDALWLVDGDTGSVLWRAAAGGSSAAAVDARLQSPWRAGWRLLTAGDGQLRLYGVDLAGMVWRLLLPAAGTAVPELRAVADLADPAQPAGLEHFEDAPSLAWLGDAETGRLPVLTVASRGGDAASPAGVFALRDRMAAGGAFLQRGDLASWPLHSLQPPAHVWGWQRRWRDAGEDLATAPSWLQGQVVLATETPQPVSACGARQWLGRLYRLPWKRGTGGQAGTGEEVALAASELPLSAPVMVAADSLRWAGRAGTESAGLVLPVPVAGRQRIGKEAMPAPP